MPKISQSKVAVAHRNADKSDHAAADQHGKGSDMTAHGQPGKATTQPEAAQKQSDEPRGKSAAKSGKKA